MSTSTIGYTRAAQEKTLEAITQSQDAILKVVRGWANAVGKATPELPQVPFAKELVSAEEIIETSFDFVEQLLASQREFTKNLVSAARPVQAKKSSAGPAA